MRCLLVIHGYPPYYEAGSEVYTRTLAKALHAKGLDVLVFARIEDPFVPDFEVRREEHEGIPVVLVNHARDAQRFTSPEMERCFVQVVDDFQPDVVHFGHLSHLSMRLPAMAKQRSARTIFTLHDYWLACPRGQFLQWGLTNGEPWAACEGQENAKCGTKCYNRMMSGHPAHEGADLAYWTNWVAQRMLAAEEAVNHIDVFVSPSHHLSSRIVERFPATANRIVHELYGFDAANLSGRNRRSEQLPVIGYIGRHHPSKGLDHLIHAHATMETEAILRIWGQPARWITKFAQRAASQSPRAKLVEWPGAYDNKRIVLDVFDHCDVIVVPSIWDENSPLVIQEAAAAGVPVVTSEHGGMGELMQRGIPGTTFQHRSPTSMANALDRLLAGPPPPRPLASGTIRSIGAHVDTIIRLYHGEPK